MAATRERSPRGGRRARPQTTDEPPPPLVQLPSDTIDPNTLAFIYEHTKDAPERQWQAWQTLDLRLTVMFVASSAVVGLGGYGAVATSGGLISLGFLVAALATYLAATTVTLLSIWPRAIHNARLADVLWDRHWDEPVDSVRHTVVDTIAKAYRVNQGPLARKSTGARWLLAVLALETMLVTLSFIAARLAA